MKKVNWRDYHKFVLYYYYYIKTNENNFFDCSALNDNLVIYPNGDIIFCEYTKTYDNVKIDFNYGDLYPKKCSCDHPCKIGGNLAKNNQLENILPKYVPSSKIN